MEFAVIESIEVLENFGYEEYVYDLETSVGTFSSGEGIILKNTDSCYVKFYVDKSDFPEASGEFMKEHFRLADECAIELTKIFKPPIELEFEKIMYPFFLYAKKRYAYLEWTNTNQPNHIDYKGIQVVRRDFCQYVKDVVMTILKLMMEDRDVELAKKYAIQSVNDLLRGDIPLEKLVLSKSLNKYYKINGVKTLWSEANTPAPHVRLAQKLMKSDPMGHPKPPDRVQYVFVKTNDKKALQCDRVAHPDHMTRTHRIDTLYYLEKQLKNPIEMLFELVMDDPSILFYDAMIRRKNADNHQKNIDSYFLGEKKQIKKVPTVTKNKSEKTKANKTQKQKNLTQFFHKK